VQTQKPLTLRTILCFCDHDGQLSTVFAWANHADVCWVTPAAYGHIFSWPEATQHCDSDESSYLLVRIEGYRIQVRAQYGYRFPDKDIPK
jgi:hypothetical protein